MKLGTRLRDTVTGHSGYLTRCGKHTLRIRLDDGTTVCRDRKLVKGHNVKVEPYRPPKRDAFAEWERKFLAGEVA